MILIPSKRAIVLRLREPERVLTVIPTAKRLVVKGQQLVAVPHKIEEVKVLRNLGFDAPSPVLSFYDWPGRYTPFSAQREAAAFLTLYNRAFNLSSLGCVDSTTEYLSPTGWKYISDYDGGKVAQYHPDSGRAEFVPPTQYVKEPCRDMIRIKTKYGLDQLLSPEHRVLLIDRSRPAKREVVSAAGLLGRHDFWGSGGQIVRAGNKKLGYPDIGYANAAVPVVFTGDPGSGIPLTGPQLRVQIAVIADGHFPNKSARCVVRLKKQRKKQRLRQLLSDAGMQWQERDPEYASAVGYTVFSFQAPVRTKVFGPEFWAATEEQLYVIRDEVMHWDGTDRAVAPNSGKGWQFSSSSKESADFVQYVHSATGMVARLAAYTRERRGTTETEYVVTVRASGATALQLKGNRADGTRLRSMWIEPSTDGFKYCFIVPSSFLVLRRNGCVFCSGNTGKSLAALWAYDYLRSVGVHRRVLIVSPLSTLERTWADELFHHFPHLDYSVLYGSASKRHKLLAQEADVYIVNHDGVEILGDALRARPDIDLVIVDEVAQVARNASTARWKHLNRVVNQKDAPRACWALTGTPTPNGPTDAWAQCRLVVPENVPPYFNRFKDRVMRQVSTYTWVPKPDAMEIVREAMQPAIRFSREECVDLPPLMYETRTVELTPEQAKAYKAMLSTMRAEVENGEVLAVNEAVKMSKLIQLACIAHNTEVLTDSGWKPIQDVSRNDLVWDGGAWVATGGAIYKGTKPVASINGVRLTLDHKVWAGAWVTAKEIIHGDASERFNRTEVRIPDRYRKGGIDEQRSHETRHLDLSVRVWKCSCAGESVPTHQVEDAATELRVPPRKRAAPDDQYPPVQCMGKDEASMRKPGGQGLGKLWWAWNFCVRDLAGGVRSVLRRYARWVRTWPDARAGGQRRSLRTMELPVGDTQAAIEQQAQQQVCRYTERAHDGVGGGACVWTEGSDTGSAPKPLQVAADAGSDRTYDLLNCGPRSQFVVRGAYGRPMIVHNCGVAYGTNGEEVTLPSQPRLNAVRDIVDEAEGKVIVFVPFVSSVQMVATELSKYFEVAVIHGGVKKTDRDAIFGAFQRSDEPRVLVAQPAAMSHGLTLTAASTIVWYAPHTSNETFEQANGRITRPGQKLNTFIIMLEGTPIERKIYARLKDKQKLQGLLLDEVQARRGELIA